MFQMSSECRLNLQGFANCGGAGNAVGADGEAIPLHLYREYLSAKAGVFNLHAVCRAVCHGRYGDSSGEIRADAKDVIKQDISDEWVYLRSWRSPRR